MISAWLKDKDTREILIMLGGGVTVIGSAACAFFTWYSKEEPKSAVAAPTLTVQATYTICQSNMAKECPKNSVWINCKDNIAEWAKRECSKYEMLAPTGAHPKAYANCGPVTVSLTCYGAKPAKQ